MPQDLDYLELVPDVVAIIAAMAKLIKSVKSFSVVIFKVLI